MYFSGPIRLPKKSLDHIDPLGPRRPIPCVPVGRPTLWDPVGPVLEIEDRGRLEDRSVGRPVSWKTKDNWEDQKI